MDLSYGPEYEAFRDELRAFIAANRHRAPATPGAAQRAGADAVAWQQLLLKHGFVYDSSMMGDDYMPYRVRQGDVIECYRVIDPDLYTDTWGDRWLARYTSALIKKQWGTNMKKFAGMQLPGGITMNGQQIFDEAVAEIKEVEQMIRDTYQEPPGFLVG